MRVYRHVDGRMASISDEVGFPFLAERGHVISLVGGGGKTTLMYHLAQRFAEQGMKTVAMTTTKILRPQRFARTIDECRACWDAGEYAVCGEEAPENKLIAPKKDVLAALLAQADAVLIEADGAKRMTVKVPAEHEPVILPETDIVIGIAGVDALGGAVDAVCFRAEHARLLLGCDGAHRLTADDLATILLSAQGARKYVDDQTYYAVLNKCDDEARLERGMEVVHALEGRGHMRTVLTCFMPEQTGNGKPALHNCEYR